MMIPILGKLDRQVKSRIPGFFREDREKSQTQKKARKRKEEDRSRVCYLRMPFRTHYFLIQKS